MFLKPDLRVGLEQGEDGRAKGGGWLHTSQWLRNEILVYNLFSLFFYCLVEDACAIGRGTYIKKTREE